MFRTEPWTRSHAQIAHTNKYLICETAHVISPLGQRIDSAIIIGKSTSIIVASGPHSDRYYIVWVVDITLFALLVCQYAASNDKA